MLFLRTAPLYSKLFLKRFGQGLIGTKKLQESRISSSDRCDRVNAIYEYTPQQKQSNIRSLFIRLIYLSVNNYIRQKEKIPVS